MKKVLSVVLLSLLGSISVYCQTIEDKEKYLFDVRSIEIEADYSVDKYDMKFTEQEYSEFLDDLILSLDKLPQGKVYAPFKFIVQSNHFYMWNSQYINSQGIHFNFRYPDILFKYIEENCPMVGTQVHQEKMEFYEKLKKIAFTLIRQIESPLFLKDTFSLKIVSLENDLWERSQVLNQSKIFYLTAEKFVLGLLRIKSMWEKWQRAHYSFTMPPQEGYISYIALTSSFQYCFDALAEGTYDRPYLIMTGADTIIENYLFKKDLKRFDMSTVID